MCFGIFIIALAQKLKDICKLVEDMIKYSAVDYSTGMKELESITRSVNAHCNHLQQAAEEAKRESIAADMRCRELESQVNMMLIFAFIA